MHEVISLHTQEPELIMSEDDRAKLSRIDERTLHVSTRLLELIQKLEKDYVTKSEFWPVRAIVYGLVTVILIGVITAMLTLLING